MWSHLDRAKALAGAVAHFLRAITMDVNQAGQVPDGGGAGDNAADSIGFRTFDPSNAADFGYLFA